MEPLPASMEGALVPRKSLIPVEFVVLRWSAIPVKKEVNFLCVAFLILTKVVGRSILFHSLPR